KDSQRPGATRPIPERLHQGRRGAGPFGVGEGGGGEDGGSTRKSSQQLLCPPRGVEPRERQEGEGRRLLVEGRRVTEGQDAARQSEQRFFRRRLRGSGRDLEQGSPFCGVRGELPEELGERLPPHRISRLEEEQRRAASMGGVGALRPPVPRELRRLG